MHGQAASVPPFSGPLCVGLEAAIRMNKSVWVLIGAILGAGGGMAEARPRSMQDQLMKLSPEARIEQSCNGRAAGLSARERKLKAPDEVVAYAFADTVSRGASLEAPGAAI